MAIPQIRTQEHIDIVLNRLPVWRGKERQRILRECRRVVGTLITRGEMTQAQAVPYRLRFAEELRRVAQHGRRKQANN